MSLTNSLRKSIIKLTGYWIYKRKHLPVGIDLFEDINRKTDLTMKTIFDVGANIGLTAKQFQEVFPNSIVLAFEPVANTFQILKNNVKSNEKIICHNFAFGEKNEVIEIKLFDHSQSYLNSLKVNAMNPKDSAQTEKIQVKTIDTFLNDNPEINSIDLLKIDTEGFETQVLQGALMAINSGKIKLIYLEVGFSKTNHRSTYYPSIHDFLDSNGFSFFGMYEITHKEINIKYNYGNALFIHDSVTNHVKH